MENFKSINHNISHRIYLEFHSQGLSCLITDKHKSPILFESFGGLSAARLESLIQSRPYFREIYSSSRLVLDLPKYVLFPADNFPDEKDASLLFNLSHRKREDEQLTELEENAEIKAICAVNSEIHELLSHLFPGLRIYHHVHYLLNDTAWFQSKGENIAIYFRNHELTVLVKRNEVVLFINTFKTESEQDIRYYTMFAAEQTGIDALNATLFIWPSGFDEKAKSWFEPYFKEIEYLDSNEALFQGLSIKESENFKNHSLLQALLRCES